MASNNVARPNPVGFLHFRAGTRKGRQRSMYSKEQGDAICALIEQGHSLRKACAASGGPDPSTVLRWVKANPEFAQQYAQAREIGYQLLADELLEISDDTTHDTVATEEGERANSEWIARSRLRVDTRKWMLAKMLPKVYGEKLEQTIQGPDGGPVRHGVTVSPEEAYKRMLGG